MVRWKPVPCAPGTDTTDAEVPATLITPLSDIPIATDVTTITIKNVAAASRILRPVFDGVDTVLGALRTVVVARTGLVTLRVVAAFLVVVRRGARGKGAVAALGAAVLRVVFFATVLRTAFSAMIHVECMTTL